MRKGLLLFGLMVIAQWLVPWLTINDSERVLREGLPFKFRTAPVDPHDWFRGEYVTLRFALEDEDLPGIRPLGEDVFAVLEERDGEVAFTHVLEAPPTDGRPYLRCTVDYAPYADSALFRVDLPFDRFYLEEGKGARTENLIGQRAAEVGPELPAYAVVRVLDGEGVIEDLVVGDRSIHRWLEEAE